MVYVECVNGKTYELLREDGCKNIIENLCRSKEVEWHTFRTTDGKTVMARHVVAVLETEE